MLGAKVLTGVSIMARIHQMQCGRTGMPELVLIPAPVTTTTFLALPTLSATSCSNADASGTTWIVGMLRERSVSRPEEGVRLSLYGGDGRAGASRQAGSPLHRRLLVNDERPRAHVWGVGTGHDLKMLSSSP